jgi:SAM-dependent methyltransferase
MTAAAPCPACRAEGAKSLGHSRSLVPLFADRQLARCHACGLVYLADPPPADRLAELNARYWAVAQAASRYSELMHTAQMRSRADYLQHLGALDAGRILDIGAGTGLLGRVLRERGWRGVLQAVEADPGCEPALRKNGAAAVWRDLADCRERAFDLIVLSHVLEHIAAPRDFLAMVRARLSTGGHVFIEVPNQDHRHKLDFGSHLLSFSPPALASLVDSTPGLAVRDIRSVGRPLEMLVGAGTGASSRRDPVRRLARRVMPEWLWQVASDIADRRRAARVTVSSLEQELQLSVYGAERQWIRCLARAVDAG